MKTKRIMTWKNQKRMAKNDADGYMTVGDTHKRRKKAEKKKSKGKSKKTKADKTEIYQTPVSSPLHCGEEPQSDSTNMIHPDSSSLESDDDDDDDGHTGSNEGNTDEHSQVVISPSYPDCAQPLHLSPNFLQDKTSGGSSRPWSGLVREAEDDLNLTKD